MSFSLRFQAHSEVGRVRKNNQDAGYASPNLLLVADGMGGAAAGDLASAVLAKEASKSDRRISDDDLLSLVAGILERGNSKLADLVTDDLSLDGMGTTFSGAAFSGTHIGIGHIGDSRCYLLRDGELRQLTHDHSWVQSLIDDGRLTPEQAATHPHRSLILKVLNGAPDFDPDYELFPVALGDRLLFCSDGLSGLIEDAGIQELLAQPDLAKAVAELAETANNNGGHDNITIVAADVVAADEELDVLPGQLVGSATEREIPTIAQAAEGSYPTPTTKPQDEETARYAPSATRRKWPSVLGVLVLVALLLGGAIWGVSSYAKTRYFVSAEEGTVAIYNGLPGSILGYSLNNLVKSTSTKVEDLPKFYQRTVENGIGVGSLDEAQTTAVELAAMAKRCIEIRQLRESPSPSPSSSPTPQPSRLSTQPAEYSTKLAPTTPPVSEGDPEDC